MGLYDRDYVRDEPPPGVQLRAPRSMVVTIIMINVAVWLANYLFTHEENTLTYSLSATVYSVIRTRL